MAKLYAITAGEYSDYHIITCTTDKQRAENMAKIYDAEVEEYDDGIIDENIPWWIVRSYNMTEAKVEDGMAKLNLSGADYVTNDCLIYDYRKDSGYCVIYVKAPIEEKACKIAQDEIAKYFYEKEQTSRVLLTGKLLNFDTVDKCGRIFPSDCKIEWSEATPICYIDNVNGYYPVGNRVPIGRASIEKTDEGLIVHGETFGFPDLNPNIKAILDEGENLYFGGYYRVIDQSDEDKDKQIFRNLKLLSVDILPEGSQADDDLKVHIEGGLSK